MGCSEQFLTTYDPSERDEVDVREEAGEQCEVNSINSDRSWSCEIEGTAYSVPRVAYGGGRGDTERSVTINAWSR